MDVNKISKSQFFLCSWRRRCRFSSPRFCVSMFTLGPTSFGLRWTNSRDYVQSSRVTSKSSWHDRLFFVSENQGSMNLLLMFRSTNFPCTGHEWSVDESFVWTQPFGDRNVNLESGCTEEILVTKVVKTLYFVLQFVLYWNQRSFGLQV